MAHDSYLRLYTEQNKCENYDVVFREALDDLAGEVNFSWVKSCVAFGPGSGEREIELVRRLLPDLRAFHAVEKDAESAAALRANFRAGRLPGVETSVVETSLESWTVDSPVDAALLLTVLPQSHANAADRKALFQKLMTVYLSPGGIVVVCDNVTTVRTGYVLVMERLGWPRLDFDVLQNEMLEAGFRLVASRDLKLNRDLSNPSDGLVEYIRMLTCYERSEQEVRAAVDDVFSQPNMALCLKKLAIFAK